MKSRESVPPSSGATFPFFFCCPTQATPMPTGKVQDLRMDVERRRIEEALRASERRARDLFESIPIGIYRTTPDGRVLLANPALLRMLGFDSFAEYAARNLEQEFLASYPRKLFKERLERDGVIRGLEAIWQRRDGTTVFVRENARAVRDHTGHMLYYEGTVEDITERKQAEEKLAASEKQLAEAQKIAHLGSWEWDVAADRVTWSDELFRIFGLRPQEFGTTYEA